MELMIMKSRMICGMASLPVSLSDALPVFARTSYIAFRQYQIKMLMFKAAFEDAGLHQL